MEIATVRRTLNHTLTELQRAVDRYEVAAAADLYALAWHQAAQAPPSETREQRARLQSFKEILGSRRWQDEERRKAASLPADATPRPERPAVPRPVADRDGPAPAPRRTVVWTSGDRADTPASPAQTPRPVPQRTSPSSATRPNSRAAEPALLDPGRLWEIATGLRPLLERTARDGATISWPQIGKRQPGLPRLHRDDQSVILWLVDEDRHDGEPLLSALITVGNRQMHPRFPAIAEQLGVSAGHDVSGHHTAWSYEVLKVHQYWRHRH
ncbi:hypothetical protein [Streptomyces sp. NPDC058268]|uniref:hypothetical protein n=1 Tax=Streptomyces sp. NPDC058268 TaxID=3346413 RepID=UPI0036ED3EC9